MCKWSQDITWLSSPRVLRRNAGRPQALGNRRDYAGRSRGQREDAGAAEDHENRRTTAEPGRSGNGVQGRQPVRDGRLRADTRPEETSDYRKCRIGEAGEAAFTGLKTRRSCFQSAKKLVAITDFRARQTAKARIWSRVAYRGDCRSGGNSQGHTRSDKKGHVFKGPILDSPFQPLPELSTEIHGEPQI